jgi:hypothetical protein
MNYAAHATRSQNQNPADYFYSAATHRSRGVLWPIFTPARISAEIHLVDVEMLSFDLPPCIAFAGEVFDKTNWNFVLHSLTVGFPNRTKEQHPSFTVAAFFFL